MESGGKSFPNKGRVRIKPDWLDSMIPPQWFQVAEALAELAATNKVPADKMRLFIRVGSAMQGIPLVEAVRMMINGEIELRYENGDTATERPRKSGLILPPGN